MFICRMLVIWTCEQVENGKIGEYKMREWRNGGMGEWGNGGMGSKRISPTAEGSEVVRKMGENLHFCCDIDLLRIFFSYFDHRWCVKKNDTVNGAMLHC